MRAPPRRGDDRSLLRGAHRSEDLLHLIAVVGGTYLDKSIYSTAAAGAAGASAAGFSPQAVKERASTVASRAERIITLILKNYKKKLLYYNILKIIWKVMLKQYKIKNY